MWKRLNLNRLLFALLLTVISLGTGIIGFIAIEGYSLLDALYMTMITVSTVGYGEVHPLSSAGRLFVSIYIFFNLLVVAYLLSVLTTYIFEGGLLNAFAMFRSDQEISHLEGHVIVCGFGRNGSKAYDELRASGTQVVIIELDEVLLKTAAEISKTTLLSVLGDATDDNTLRAAGVDRARALITALPKDTDNVFVALTARELNPNIRIIARASAKTSERKLLRAGANSVVMPDEIGGSHMANLVIRPEVIRFLDMISGLGPNKLRLEELRLEDLKPEWHARSIRELDIFAQTGATVIGLKHRNDKMEVSPNPDIVPTLGDVLLVLGTDEQVYELIRLFRA
ncbi:potassium channel protein [Hymenobacter qilianensis]|uniref:Potassium channel protein n=1 Tax=Hymenobacter qilianensis TaxID=1385715 RepID=A0ACB5PQU7_9BACT|nr:potassium channel protein [Hymenobacter qilianensis]GGF62661.1 potassium channel protein [Hymenobacter qilianensis]